jgi:flagellar hook-basal body complex protein FliE
MMNVNLLSGGPLTALPTGMGDLLSGGLSSGDGASGFGDVFKTAMTQVSTLQDGAQTQVGTLLQGGNADMSKVMISVEKADVAFQLMMQVRNKIVSAYQDIEKMQF